MKLPDAVQELPLKLRKLWESSFKESFIKYEDRTDGIELSGAEAWDAVQLFQTSAK